MFYFFFIVEYVNDNDVMTWHLSKICQNWLVIQTFPVVVNAWHPNKLFCENQVTNERLCYFFHPIKSQDVTY